MNPDQLFLSYGYGTEINLTKILVKNGYYRLSYPESS
jgi:hypothetical protein